MTEEKSVIEDYIGNECNGDGPDLTKIMRLVELGKRGGVERKFRVRYHNSELMPWGNSDYPVNVKGLIFSDFDIAKEIIHNEIVGRLTHNKDLHSKRARYTIYLKNQEE